MGAGLAVGAAAALLGMGLSRSMSQQGGSSYSPQQILYQDMPVSTMPDTPKLPGQDEGKAEAEVDALAEKQAALRSQSSEYHTSGLGLSSPAYTQKKKLLGGSA